MFRYILHGEWHYNIAVVCSAVTLLGENLDSEIKQLNRSMQKHIQTNIQVTLPGSGMCLCLSFPDLIPLGFIQETREAYFTQNILGMYFQVKKL